MPELPDITIYIEALNRRIVGERLEMVRVNSPFLLRTFEPPLELTGGQDGSRATPCGEANCHWPR